MSYLANGAMNYAELAQEPVSKEPSLLELSREQHARLEEIKALLINLRRDMFGPIPEPRDENEDKVYSILSSIQYNNLLILEIFDQVRYIASRLTED